MSKNKKRSPSSGPSPVLEGSSVSSSRAKEGRPAASKSNLSPLPNRGGAVLLFFLLAWLWASWWMGDVMRIASERSFFAPDTTLMHWLLQQRMGWLWLLGRALLTLYHWPLLGGLLVAALLTVGSCLFGYCLHLAPRWRWLHYLPAAAWMTWTASAGLNLFYRHEPGRILAIPFLFLVLCGTFSIITWLYKRRQMPLILREAETAQPSRSHFSLFILHASFFILIFALPLAITHFRHPYMRPLTRMQVQLMHNDYKGIIRTAHDHPAMSYRQTAGYYVIALARTGQLAEKLFDIKLDYDTIWTETYHGLPSASLNYHIVDCNYHAGLIRAARHYALEDLTMDGPALYTLKYMVKISLLEGDWKLARKYLHILYKVPFEGAFLRKYEPMVQRPDLVQADPEFAAILHNLPPYHTFEQMAEKPAFVGFYATLQAFSSPEMLEWSTVACLYSKRMPDFLMRCRKLVGTTPPRSIAEGLVIQAAKNPEILQAFPQLDMLMDRFQLFLQDARPYMKDRERGSEALFEKYHGYYPYYYFFGNLRSTRKPDKAEEQEHNKAGVN